MSISVLSVVAYVLRLWIA
ncbi:hypothetical protein [Parasphingorhabdus litoris]|nr:hypothetical protein [Parasphingorhabdus litoris]